MGNIFVLSARVFLYSLLTIAFFVCVSVSFVSAQEADEEAEIPEAPQVSSTTHPDEGEWYRELEGEFSWPLPARMTAVAVSVSDDPDEEPETAFRPPIESITIDDEFVEGEQYVHVQFKDDENWGEVAHYQVNIDTVAPSDLSFTIDNTAEIDEGVVLTVSASARDETSGIAHYEFFLGDLSLDVVEDTSVSNYSLLVSESGTYDISVMAYDVAGNSVESEARTIVVGGIASQEKNSLVLSGSELFLVLLSLIVIALSLYIMIRNHEVKLREKRLREENEEVREEATRVFTALRNEVLNQIQNIKGKKRLTQKDEEVVQNLMKVLNVSESMLKKEIADVEKLLK